MKRDQLIYLSHILDSFEKAMEYMQGVTYDRFLLDEEKQDAVIRKIEVAGEAAKNISDHVRHAHPHIPWRAMAGMRDKLIHAYFEVDIDIVWDTVTSDIPVLIYQLRNLTATLEEEE